MEALFCLVRATRQQKERLAECFEVSPTNNSDKNSVNMQMNV